MKIFKVGFVECVSDDFNIQFVEFGCGKTVFEIRSQRCFDKDRIIQLFDSGGYTQGRQRVEPAEWMTSFEEFMSIALMEGSRDQ